MSDAFATFRAARDQLLSLRADRDRAMTDYAAPRPEHFNWALDWFDQVAATPETGGRPALWVIEEDGTQTRVTYAEMASRSSQVAMWLRSLGGARGDRVLLMLGNIKLGAVVIPATTLLTADDLVDRIDRGSVRHVVAGSAHTARFAGVPGSYTRVAVGEPVTGWTAYSDSASATAEFVSDGETRADDTLLLYFTSGTTARPKLVEHTHVSYPIGHLSTMYWVGLRPGDVHLNISSPGWAKHAW